MGVVTYGTCLVSASSFSPSSYPETLKLRSSPLLFLPIFKPKVPISSLRISNHRGEPRIAVCSISTNSDENYASEASKEATFDIKLPRRNLIVQFTCNACGERTQRTINRVAYERGTVFVQCAGCLVNHKLVDNLGLIVEYNLQEDLDADSDATKQG